MMPFDCYKTFLAMKSHFTKETFDYQKFGNRLSKITLKSFYKRKDRFYFESMVRKYPDKDIENFFVSNFISGSDPQLVYMATIVKTGEHTYREWQKRIQSLSYVFKNETGDLFDSRKVDDVFNCSKGHPPILKSHLGGKTSLETMIICDKILGYKNNFDKKLDDVVWKSVSMKMKKYSPFLNIDVFHYKKILKDLVLDTAR
jgi:hypothetical protein